MYSFKQNIWQGLLFFFKLIFATLFIYGIYLGYQYWLESNLPPISLQSFGLGGELPPDLFLSGNLYFSAVVDDESTLPYIYKKDLVTDQIIQVLDKPGYAYSSGAPYNVAAIEIAEGDNIPTWQPVRHDPVTGLYSIFPHMWAYLVDDLIMSPDNIHYAYSYLAVSTEDFEYIEYHNVALHNYQTDELVILESAIEPYFILGGSDLLYMKEEGIYRYNLASRQSYPFSMFYENLTLEEDFAVSPDDSTLVFTSPYLNLISIQRLNENFMTDELGIIVTPDISYRHPVIDPTNRFYTVMATNATGDIQAEVRLLEHDDLIDRMVFDGFKPKSIIFDQWLSF